MSLRHRSHRLVGALAAATAATALAAPPAPARIDPPTTPEYNMPSSSPPSAPIVRVVDDSFDWGAAAIGAGGAGAIALAALAAFASRSRARPRTAR